VVAGGREKVAQARDGDLVYGRERLAEIGRRAHEGGALEDKDHDVDDVPKAVEVAEWVAVELLYLLQHTAGVDDPAQATRRSVHTSRRGARRR
jgi:hypothetical protein